MSNNIIRNMQKYKHPIIISLIVTALALYALPLEKLFTEVALAQNNGNTRSPYGNARQGPPSSTPGNPGGPGSQGQGEGQGPPEDTGPPAPRNGPPQDNPGQGEGQGPPQDNPGQGPPEDRGPPAPRNGPPR
jgi:hypothetical protein